MVLALVACDTHLSNSERYLQRLANALDVAPTPVATIDLTRFPATSSLVIKRPSSKINLLEFLEVNRCNLGSLVGARNSGLGRVHTASQRWLYDTQLVAGLLACEESTPALQALATSRQAELGIAAFNALFTGAEWHGFVTPALAENLLVVDEGGVERALLALTALFVSAELGGINSEAMSEFEGHLATLRFSAALGEQRRAWAVQSETLEQATRMLLSALETNPACRTGTPTEAGKIRQSVFQQFYVAGVQPELAGQGQPDRGWLRALSALVASVVAGTAIDGVVPPQAEQVEDWHQHVFGEHPANEYGRWKAAISAHSSAWQRQLGICGLMPGI